MTAYLMLEDGKLFEGTGVGAPGVVIGNLTIYDGLDYMNVTTDPSSEGRIIAFMHPLLGSWGVNTENCETGKCCLKGIVAREVCEHPTHWRSAESIDYFLKRSFTPGISGIDMAALKDYVQKKNIVKAAVVNSAGFDGKDALLSQIKGFKGRFLFANAVKIPENFGMGRGRPRIGICDFGVSRLLARLLVQHGAAVTLLPPYDAASIIERGNFDGLVVSNGAGAPRHHPGIVEALQDVIATGLPVMGVGAGCGFAAMACGVGLKDLSHFGTRFPVRDTASGRVHFTRQTHGYVIDRESSDDIEVTFESVHDGSAEGFRHKTLSVTGVHFLPCADVRLGGTDVILQTFFDMVKKGACVNA